MNLRKELGARPGGHPSVEHFQGVESLTDHHDGGELGLESLEAQDLADRRALQERNRKSDSGEGCHSRLHIHQAVSEGENELAGPSEAEGLPTGDEGGILLLGIEGEEETLESPGSDVGGDETDVDPAKEFLGSPGVGGNVPPEVADAADLGFIGGEIAPGGDGGAAAEAGDLRLHFEVPSAIARVALFGDSLSKPLGPPVVEVCAVAKRDLRKGEVLDRPGEYMTYGECCNSDEMATENYLPEGLVEGCKLLRPIERDQPITYDDITLPVGRMADAFRAEQNAFFCRSTGLDLLHGLKNKKVSRKANTFAH